MAKYSIIFLFLFPLFVTPWPVVHKINKDDAVNAGFFLPYRKLGKGFEGFTKPSIEHKEHRIVKKVTPHPPPHPPPHPAATSKPAPSHKSVPSRKFKPHHAPELEKSHDYTLINRG